MALQPWEDRPRPDQGDKRSITTFAAVGRALTQWEYLEAKLAELFGALVGSEPGEMGSISTDPAARAFGAVLGSANRITMIEEAAKAHFRLYPDSTLEKRLLTFTSTELRHFSGKRDNIAHGIVESFFSKRSNSLKLGYWLIPSYYATKKYKLDGIRAYAYTAAEIDYFAKQFDRLWIEADALVSAIAKQRA